MEIATIIGLIAGVLTTTGFIPQAYKIYKTKSTGDISLTMYLVLGTGASLWLIYGILINELPVIVANAIGVTFIIAILFLKIKYK